MKMEVPAALESQGAVQIMQALSYTLSPPPRPGTPLPVPQLCQFLVTGGLDCDVSRVAGGRERM